MIGSTDNKVNAAEDAVTVAGMPGLAGKITEASEATSGLLNPIMFAGYNNYRYQNTLIKGGFKDSRFSSNIRAGGRRAGMRSFAQGSLTPTNLNSSSFLGRKKCLWKNNCKRSKTIK